MIQGEGQMKRIPNSIQTKLSKRLESNALRDVKTISETAIDFASNDYLGLARSPLVTENAEKQLGLEHLRLNGATGSRLISGNHVFYNTLETYLAEFHRAEYAVVFNSGYDANLGILSSVPQRGDLLFYDEYSHASIRDGISLSKAKAYRFRHNDLEDLSKKLQKFQEVPGEKYIVTESVFSMDGDMPNLSRLCDLSQEHQAYLIIDEAHATGVIGKQGEGLVQHLGLEDRFFARIHTFGKAIGSHGAAILGSKHLREYLINFARPLIYTTALPPHSLATTFCAYELMRNSPAIGQLKDNIQFFQQSIEQEGLKDAFIKIETAIQSCIIPGNHRVKKIANVLQAKGFAIKAILSPTVPEGKERLRFCIHSFNQKDEMLTLLQNLAAELINSKYISFVRE